MKTQTVSIIGLQRVGASIGLAIKQSSLDLKVVGYAADRKTAKLAKEMGAVDKVHLNMINAASTGDIVILAVPFSQMEETLKLVGRDIQEHAVVMDTGMLKEAVAKWANSHMPQGHYVGVMPVLAAQKLADTRLGIEAADAALFENSVFCLMPSPTVAEAAVQTAANFGKLLGAEPFFIDPGEFDIYAQALETMPGLMSAAYFRTLTSSNGWRDMLRFASLSFAQSTANLNREADIAHLAFHNKAATLRWLDALINNLMEMRRWIVDGDRDTMAALMEELNIQRDEWLYERSENNWNEVNAPDVERQNIFQQMFIGNRKIKRDDD